MNRDSIIALLDVAIEHGESLDRLISTFPDQILDGLEAQLSTTEEVAKDCIIKIKGNV